MATPQTARFPKNSSRGTNTRARGSRVYQQSRRIYVSNQRAQANTFTELATYCHNMLQTAYDELVMRSQLELLNQSERAIMNNIHHLETARVNLLKRLYRYYPGEDCTLIRLINYATVAAYQYRLIIESKRRQRVAFFNWAAVFQHIMYTNPPPCHLVTIPSIAYEFDFLCCWLPPGQYEFICKYFYYYLMYR